MSKKPTKTSIASSKTKSKQTSLVENKGSKTTKQPEPNSVTTTKIHSFKHSCIEQNFVLVWLDENIDENNDGYHPLISQLQSIVNTIEAFNDIDQCVHFLSQIRKQNIFLIVSDRLGQRTMTLTHDMDQLIAVFIFCNNGSQDELWMKKWPKVRSISNNITELCESLKEAARKMDDDPIGMSFAPSNDIDNEDLDHLDQSFMYTELIKEILLELNYDDKSVQDLVDYCRKKYAGQQTELKTVTDIEQEYRKKEPIWWYTLESFLYRMLNKTLREQHFESIIRMGFFIYDLHRHIEQLHKEQKTKFTEPFKVYRSQGMTLVDFEKLKKTKGGLLAFNSFLSTSLDSDAAQKFLRTSLRDSQLITIFFTLSIDPSVSSAPFALIDEVSYYKTEKEILFSMLTVFRIERIEQNDADDRIWNVDLTLTSDSDQQMNRLLERMRKEIEGSTPLYRLGALMIKLDQLNQAEEVYKTLFEHTTDQLEKGNLFYQLGQIKYNRGHNDEAISDYQEALKIYSETLPSDHPNIATIYNNIGLVYDSKNDYSQALASYQKAQQIYENKLESDHPILANCYNNIASAYDNLKNYKQALTFYDKSYQIYEKTLPAKHPHIATYYSNIGTVHSNMKEYAKALACFEKAVQIGRDTLPDDHSDLDTYRKNLESMRNKLKK